MPTSHQNFFPTLPSTPKPQLDDTPYLNTPSLSPDNVDSANVDCYDPVTNTWRRCSSMNIPRNRAGVASIDATIYILGGSNGNVHLSSVEMYAEHLALFSLPPHFRLKLTSLSHHFHLILISFPPNVLSTYSLHCHLTFRTVALISLPSIFVSLSPHFHQILTSLSPNFDFTFTKL